MNNRQIKSRAQDDVSASSISNTNVQKVVLPGVHHINRSDWLLTPDREPRGYIQPQHLKELWFHTGTICNLQCPFCFEGSKPGDNRLNKVTLDDVEPFIREGVDMGVERFSFTGGEPFVVKDMVKILALALEHRPCLVLTNATAPLHARISEIASLTSKPHPLSFRISFDYPDPERHDVGRGKGNFALAMKTMSLLHAQGFNVSIARQRDKNENQDSVEGLYRQHFKKAGVPEDTRIVSFPDFLTPGSIAHVPHITETCMTTYHDDAGRAGFMCQFSKMIVKQNGRMRVYACTLVDDDGDYDLGGTLSESMRVRVMLKHHRCYSCFAQGASCSEI